MYHIVKNYLCGQIINLHAHCRVASWELEIYINYVCDLLQPSSLQVASMQPIVDIITIAILCWQNVCTYVCTYECTHV